MSKPLFLEPEFDSGEVRHYTSDIVLFNHFVVNESII